MRRGALVLALFGACGGGDKDVSTPANSTDHRISLGERESSRRSLAPANGEDESLEEGVAIEGLKGHLSQYDIQRGLEKRSDEISDCYHGKIGRRRYVGGSVELAFVVRPDGTVRQVTAAKSSVGDLDIELCLLRISEAMQFASPDGGDAEFSVPLEFSPRSTPLWWGDDRVAEEVADHLESLAECKTEGVSVPASARITGYVVAGGSVTSVGVAAGLEPIATEWATCIREKMATWKLSDPRGRVAKFEFDYPRGAR